ncbi:MAG: thioredoxin 1 [Pseudoalteromonas tetraodonis]|jgi:thioredoxin 1
MKTTSLNESNFEATISASDKPVLVDFYADWCGPCQMLSPIIDEIAEEQADQVVVAKLNIDGAQATAARFGITSIPALIVFKDGEPVARANGMQSKDAIRKLIASAA